MLRSVDLSDYMLHDPVTITVEDDMFTAIGLIHDHKVSGLCVVDEQGMLVGVLSELDCDVHADLVDVADDMLKKGHRRRPVLDHGKLVGQITCRQLLRVVSHFNETAAAASE